MRAKDEVGEGGRRRSLADIEPTRDATRQEPFPERYNMENENWSGRWDSNPRPQPWQGCALPLSYTRTLPGNPVQDADGVATASMALI